MTDTPSTTGLPTPPNGGVNGELPPTREAIVEQGLRISQETAAERDALLRVVAELRTDIAGYKAMLDVAELNVTRLESHVQTAVIQRDQAIADRAVYETLFIAFQSLLRTFKIPNAPLVRDYPEERDYAEDLDREPLNDHGIPALRAEPVDRLS